MNIDQLNAVRIKALDVQLTSANAQIRKLTDRLDVISDQLDHEIGNRIFHEKRAERLAWFIKHLSEQLQSLDEETDRIKMAEEI